MSELKTMIEGISSNFDAFAKKNDRSIGELRDRVEAIEAGKDRPSKSGGSEYSSEQREYKSTFLDWIRKPKDASRTNRLSENQRELEKKDVVIGSNASGGFALPEQIEREIEKRVRQMNPFRQLVSVRQCGTNDYKQLVSLGDGTAGWVSETGTRSATSTPNLRERAPTMGELYAYPQASNWSLDDLFFDVEKFLVDDISEEWSSMEATAIVSGNGTARPTGFLNTTPVSTADDASPLRAAGAIQFTSLAGFGPSSPVNVNIDALINLVSQVKEKYIAGGEGVAFVMHRLTLSALRRLKASTAGSYFLEPNLQAGMPASLLGYPVFTSDAMPTIANDAFVVAFGNWRRGYLLADRVGMSITVDPYTNPGHTRFYVRKRLGGCILNNDALKILRCAD